MSHTVLAILGIQAVSLAGLLAMARFSRQLVDDEGHPITSGWRVRRIPAGRKASHEKAETTAYR